MFWAVQDVCMEVAAKNPKLEASPEENEQAVDSTVFVRVIAIVILLFISIGLYNSFPIGLLIMTILILAGAYLLTLLGNRPTKDKTTDTVEKMLLQPKDEKADAVQTILPSSSTETAKIPEAPKVNIEPVVQNVLPQPEEVKKDNVEKLD